MQIDAGRSRSWPQTTKNSDFKRRGHLHGFLRCERSVPRRAAEFADASGHDGLFRAKWSDGVHEEWITALLRNRPDLSREKLERTRMLMDKHAADALVTAYEDLIEGLDLPDPDGRPVLAAAIRGQARVIHGERQGFSCGNSDTVRNRAAAPG
jgi:hypothetical protein